MSKNPEHIFNDLPDDAEVTSRARAIFRSACEATDSYHALRLGLARRKALHAGAGHAVLRWWAPMAGAAACCVLALGLAWMHPAQQARPATGTPSDSQVAAAPAEGQDADLPDPGSTQMEMVEDFGFYRWVATQPVVAPSASRESR